jgi:hypothetical protein
MIKYKLVLSPYNAYRLEDWQPIIINQFLLSTECRLVTKKDWANLWHPVGWRPVDVYVASNETPKPGDQVWSRALAISTYEKDQPIHIFKKIVLQPDQLSHISITKLNEFLRLEYIEDLSTLIQPNLVFTHAK